MKIEDISNHSRGTVAEFADDGELCEIPFVECYINSDTHEMAYVNITGPLGGQLLVHITKYWRTRVYTFEVCGRMVEGNLKDIGIKEFDIKQYGDDAVWDQSPSWAIGRAIASMPNRFVPT